MEAGGTACDRDDARENLWKSAKSQKEVNQRVDIFGSVGDAWERAVTCGIKRKRPVARESEWKHFEARRIVVA